MRLSILFVLAPLALTACKKSDEAAAPAPTPAAPAAAAATSCPGFKGDKPVPFCLATAPAGCKLEDVKDNDLTIRCTNGAITLSYYDPTDDSLKSEMESMMKKTTDPTTKIAEQGVPAGGDGKFIAYERADQKGMTNSAAIFKGKQRVWVCWAQVSETKPERDTFIKACRSLKEL
jgi:hypothetical protein